VHTPDLHPHWGHSGREKLPFTPRKHPRTATPPPVPGPVEPNARVEISFRHSGWRTTRERVWEALNRSDASIFRLNAFISCGMDAWVEESEEDPGHYRVRCSRCHDRFCLPCAQERSRLIASNLRAFLEGKQVRMITLTLRSADEPLRELLDRLYASFVRLRRCKLWRACVTGGAAFCEVKWCSQTQRWHPHLHILATGKYLAQKALADAWYKATGDSYVVDVRFAGDLDKVSAYVVKYASKPLDPSFLAIPDRLLEAIGALAGRRLCLTFGTWSGLRLLEFHPQGAWTPVASLTVLLERARAGDAFARDVINSLRRSPGLFASEEPPHEETSESG